MWNMTSELLEKLAMQVPALVVLVVLVLAFFRHTAETNNRILTRFSEINKENIEAFREINHENVEARRVSQDVISKNTTALAENTKSNEYQASAIKELTNALLQVVIKHKD